MKEFHSIGLLSVVIVALRARDSASAAFVLDDDMSKWEKIEINFELELFRNR